MHKKFKPGDIVTIIVPPRPDVEYGHWIVIEHRTDMHPDGSKAWVKCLSPGGTIVDWTPAYVSHVVSYDI